MIRLVLYLVAGVAVWWAATTIPLGNKTLWSHLRAIWSTPEAKEMRNGLEQTAKPAVDKVKRGVEVGVREAAKDAVTAELAEPTKGAAGGPAMGQAELAVATEVEIAAVLRRAQRALEAGDYLKAALLAEDVLQHEPKAVSPAAARIATEARCRRKEKAGAVAASRHLAKAEYGAVQAMCRRHGVALP